MNLGDFRGFLESLRISTAAASPMQRYHFFFVGWPVWNYDIPAGSRSSSKHFSSENQKYSLVNTFKSMSAGIARGRLLEERKAWRRDHPYGFYARPVSKGDGSTNIMSWTAGIPAKEGTDWEGGVYKVTMDFSEDYPSKHPKCT